MAPVSAITPGATCIKLYVVRRISFKGIAGRHTPWIKRPVEGARGRNKEGLDGLSGNYHSSQAALRASADDSTEND